MGTFNQSSSLISIEFNHKIAAMLQASKYFLILFCIYGTSFLFENKLLAQTNPDQPNILLIIAVDMGHDITPGFLESARMPNTHTLDSLRNTGLTFTNAWARKLASELDLGIFR